MSAVVRTHPASWAQERLWLFEQADNGEYQHLLPLVLRLRGPLSVGSLVRAFDQLIERHEALRTTVSTETGQLIGSVHHCAGVPLRMIDLGLMEARLRQALVSRVAEQEAQRRFDLSVAPYIRVVLVRSSQDEHTLLITLHHLAGDGWSQGLMLRELAALYGAALRNEAPPLPALSFQYGDHVAEQRAALCAHPFVRQLAYWKEHLAGAPTEIALPVDRHGSVARGGRASTVVLDVDGPTVAAIRALSKDVRTSPFAVVLTSFAAALSSWTGERDFLVGVPMTNRSKRRTEALIGLFVNVMPVRFRMAPEGSFRAHVAAVREALLGALATQDLPFGRLVEELHPARTPGRPALVQVACGEQQISTEPVELPGLETRLESPGVSRTPFELLAVASWQPPAGLRIAVTYSTKLFERASIEGFCAHWRTLLETAAASPDLTCRALLTLAPAAHSLVLERAVRKTVAPPSDLTVSTLFERQANSHPDAVAVVDAALCLTYGTLRERAGNIAARLKSIGVGPECRVGLCCDRGVAAIVCIVGIVLAGAAYVPLDPQNPSSQLLAMAGDAAVSACIVVRPERLDWPADILVIPLAELDSDSGATPEPDTPDRGGLCPDSLLYIMYTSGSTGRPKGVAVTHRGVVRLVHQASYVELSAAETVLLGAPLAFDASTFEIWGALLNGARLIVMPPGLNARSEFERVVAREQVTTLWLTAGLLHAYVGESPFELPTVRQLLAGGDVINPSAVDRVLSARRPPRFIAGYGPTECTTFTTTATMDAVLPPSTDVPLGRPIDHTSVWVLDVDAQPVVAGAIGSLYVGGAGLARGYWNRPDLTAERFVPDPFGVAGSRLYRTGDRVRWRPDGQLQFLGRMDDEIKIRGHRVSLAEVAEACRRQPNVRDAIVTVSGTNAETKTLEAHVVVDTPELSGESLMAALQSELPSYAVPARIKLCDRLPLTASGKIDRKALPGFEERSPGIMAPRTATEQRIADAWCAALECDAIDIHTNVFELGAGSLTLIKVHAVLENALPRPILISHLFQYPTVGALARFVAGDIVGPSPIDSGRRRAAVQSEARRQRAALNGPDAARRV